MTEISSLAFQTQDKTFKHGSCGYLVPNTEAKIVDLKNGNALGPNKKGELCIRGPQVFIEKISHIIYVVKYHIDFCFNQKLFK